MAEPQNEMIEALKKMGDAPKTITDPPKPARQSEASKSKTEPAKAAAAQPEAQQSKPLTRKEKRKLRDKEWIESLKTLSIEEMKKRIENIKNLNPQLKDAEELKQEYDRLSKEKGAALREWVKLQGIPKTDPLRQLCKRLNIIQAAKRSIKIYKTFIERQERKLKKEQDLKEKQARKKMLEDQAKLAGKPQSPAPKQAGPQVFYVQRKSKPLSPPSGGP